ncbi:hypothetical protein USB125703_01414 [Pseudoclavibacter triregionum]|nr:hypothetical protein USB125703_01414 [Pseudoclavibacter triregionum]
MTARRTPILALGALAAAAAFPLIPAAPALAASTDIVFNEVESNGDPVGDWAEVTNTGAAPVDLSGWTFKDNDDTHAYVIPAGTVVAPGAFLTLSEAQFGFGLGGNDAVRLFDASGALVADYAWTTHATTTYGRCPDGAGAWTTTLSSTNGAANACPVTTPTATATPTATPTPTAPARTVLPWIGTPVTPVDAANTFDGDFSSLDFDPGSGMYYGTHNGDGLLYRLMWDGAQMNVVSTTTLKYPDGTGRPDAEGVTVAGGLLLVGTERNNEDNKVSFNEILAYDANAAVDGATISAVQQWNLTSLLPATGANLGIEAVEFVHDTELTGLAGYNPADYPLHGEGLAFVGVEGTGEVYAVALNSDGSAQLVATFTPGFPGVMALDFDANMGGLWVHCDDGCSGESALLDLSTGAFTYYAAPAGLELLNSEGMTSTLGCLNGQHPYFFSDDNNTDGHSLYVSYVPCAVPTETPAVTETPTAEPTDTAAATTAPTSTSTPGAKPGAGLANTGAEPAPAIALGLGALALGALAALRRRARA